MQCFWKDPMKQVPLHASGEAGSWDRVEKILTLFQSRLDPAPGCGEQNQPPAQWNEQRVSSWRPRVSRCRQSGPGSGSTLATVTSSSSCPPGYPMAVLPPTPVASRWGRGLQSTDTSFSKAPPPTCTCHWLLESWDMWVFSWDLGSLDKSRALGRRERGDVETGLAPCVLWNSALGNSVTSQEQTSPTLVPPPHSPA